MSSVTTSPKILILAASAVAVSHTGDTNETVIATVAISAGLMGLNGVLRITSQWSHPGGSGNSKTMRIRLGGVSGQAYMQIAQTTNVTTVDLTRQIANRNSASSQITRVISSSNGGSSGGSFQTGAVDTSVAQNLVFTAQLANSGETITLESYLVELILP